MFTWLRRRLSRPHAIAKSCLSNEIGLCQTEVAVLPHYSPKLALVLIAECFVFGYSLPLYA